MVEEDLMNQLVIPQRPQEVRQQVTLRGENVPAGRCKETERASAAGVEQVRAEV